jgi:hypothetical protein
LGFYSFKIVANRISTIMLAFFFEITYDFHKLWLFIV